MRDEVGTLRITIWVNWQGQMKRVTVHSSMATRDEAIPKAREFMKQNKNIPELNPEVTWTFTETLDPK